MKIILEIGILIGLGVCGKSIDEHDTAGLMVGVGLTIMLIFNLFSML